MSSKPSPQPCSGTGRRKNLAETNANRSRRTQQARNSAPHRRYKPSANHAMTSKDWASHFWITLVDEEGETFYANPQTGERKWAIPPGSLVLPRSADGEWYELWSDEHNLPYYYHTVKNETTWYKPDGFVIPLKAVQRFSAGKRFSLSLDSGCNVAMPEAPEASDEHSVNEDHAIQPETARDSNCDPFYAAVFSCITGKIAPDSPSEISPRCRTRSARSRARTTSAGREKETAVIIHPDISAEQQHIYEAAENEDNLDHVNVSNLSTISLSTSASTPLHTPKALQGGFSTPIASCDDTTSFLHESPYLGIEELRDSVTITADDLIGAIPRVEQKGKTVAPLKIRKKVSPSKLAEPLSLIHFAKEDRQKKHKTDIPHGNTDLHRPAGMSSGPSSPVSPKTPGTPRSPSAFFSAMFNRLPVSPSMVSASAAMLRVTEEARDVSQTLPPSDVPQCDAIPSETLTSPEPARKSNTLSSPTLAKVKKLFASSQDLLKQSEGPIDDVENEMSQSSPLDASIASNMSPSISMQANGPSPVPKDLLDDIHRFSFNEYAQQHFAASSRRHTRIFHRKEMPLEKRMKWQTGDLETSILQLNKQLRWDAQQCFTHLQRVMGDRPLKDGDIRVSMEDVNAPSSWDNATVEEARKLLAIGVNTPELRDEIYVQLLCQLSDNPSAISIYRGYQLLQVLLVVFPPSPSLAPTLRQFLIAKRGSVPRSRLGIIARYAFIKLEEIISRGPRGAVPTLFEIQAASEGAFQPSVFGETLQRVMALQVEAYPDAKIPVVLSFLADGVLALGGLKTPGIFRVAGDVDKVKELRIIIDQGRYSFAGYEDPRIAASLFKLWLRELRDPLIPIDWYHQCMEAASSASRCIEIVQRLPSLSRRIVAFVISFLQIFAQEAVTNVTLVSTASLAMIFTPSFFRGPPTSKIFDVASSGTHEDINKVFNEARIEQQFMLNLVEFLDVTRLEDEDDWIPTHGKHNSIGSSLSSSTASSAYPASSAHPYFSEVGMQGESRPSLESTTSTLSQSSRPSFGSTKRKNRFHRTRMQTAEPSRETFGTQEHSTAPGLSTSASYPIRSRAITDSFFVHGQSRSIKDLSDRLHSINHASSPPPLPDLPFIKPVIVVNEAD